MGAKIGCRLAACVTPVLLRKMKFLEEEVFCENGI